MIEIPDDATPADVVGETDILAGQDWLVRERLLAFANAMARDDFDWNEAPPRERMAFQQGSNGLVITQGHHRWIAARLAGVQIPVKIKILRDFWPGPVTFALSWTQVHWEDDPDE